MNACPFKKLFVNVFLMLVWDTRDVIKRYMLPVMGEWLLLKDNVVIVSLVLCFVFDSNG